MINQFLTTNNKPKLLLLHQRPLPPFPNSLSFKFVQNMISTNTYESCGRKFSLSEIQSATGDFNDAHLIGTGGFGRVYRGLLDGRVPVAIKRLSAKSNQGEREFAAEIATLTKLRHRNLVSLIGHCDEQGEMLLVYDYMPNGTLADHRSSLAWEQRLRVCIGAARGLDYLHSGSSIVHRDVKSTNILLDEDLVARVSDFGLAMQLGETSHVTASVKGSFGYFDPSYFTTGRLTRKSDVYAFGVVLLEVLSGRAAVDHRLSEDELCLTMWAREKIIKGKLHQIVASNLRGEISEDCLKTYVDLAKRCVHQNPMKRPTMTQVVVQLELALEKQGKTEPISSHFWLLNAIFSIVKPSGTAVGCKMVPISVPAIPLDFINIITDNFSSTRLINDAIGGKSVYRAILGNGKDAAIEKVYNQQPQQDFLQQVSIMSHLKHENVVELLGYCVHGDKRFLAYEFSHQSSLFDILHCSTSGRGLSWAQKVKIAIGAAKGLEFIHKRGQVHCNIQSSNILLFNDSSVAKIAGFDLSTRPIDVKACCHETMVAFSAFLRRVYSSPEYVSNGQLSSKTDVYSFGVVILELLTGRKPWDMQWLMAWAKHKDPVVARLKGNNLPFAGAAKMVEVAALCLREEADDRPSMSGIVQALQPLLE